MHIVIPSHNRPHSITTHLLLSGHDYMIFLHSEEQRQEYLKNPTIPPERLKVTGVTGGIAHQRQWILDNYVERGEWFLTLDDNIKAFTGNPGMYDETTNQMLPGITGAEAGKLLNQRMDTARFLLAVQKTIDEASARGAHLVGFANNSNHFFRKKLYRDVGFVVSKMSAIHHVGIEYDLNTQAKDDYAFCAKHLKTFGRVLINNALFREASHLQAGGIGKYEERLPKSIADAAHLLKEYPGLFRYKIKAGKHPESEVVMRFHSLKQIDEWRRGRRD